MFLIASFIYGRYNESYSWHQHFYIGLSLLSLCMYINTIYNISTFMFSSHYSNLLFKVCIRGYRDISVNLMLSCKHILYIFIYIYSMNNLKILFIHILVYRIYCNSVLTQFMFLRCKLVLTLFLEVDS